MSGPHTARSGIAPVAQTVSTRPPAARTNPSTSTVVDLARGDGADHWRVTTTGRRGDNQLGVPLGDRRPKPDTASGEQGPLLRAPAEAGPGAHLAEDPNGSV